MDVRTGSKLWGYSKRPRNWKKIMYKEIDESLESEASIDEIDPSHESEARIPEKAPEDDKSEEAPEDEIPEEAPEDDKPEDDDNRMVEASIEKPKITATVYNPDSSFSHL